VIEVESALRGFAIPCSIVRGGTSKGIFLLDAALPAERVERDRWIQRLFGSPDPRQIDGLGGADPLTSKLALVSPSSRPGVDVEYEHVQVGVSEPTLNYSIMCGNLASAVGYFAVLEGLVAPQVPLTRLQIFCRNNGKLISAEIPTDGDGLRSVGDTRVDGVPGCGARVALTFHDPAGALTDRLLPLDEPTSIVVLDDGLAVRVSVVDAGALYAFVGAAQLGVSGNESAAELDANGGFRDRIEEIRTAVAERIGRHLHPFSMTAGQLKVAVLARASAGERGGLEEDSVEITARVVNKERTHKAFPVGGAIALGSSVVVPGSLSHELVAPMGSPTSLRVRHPQGTFPARIYFDDAGGSVTVRAVEVERTARVLMRGTAFLDVTSSPLA
jgi:2-methylaconitate cis-trans-isomerase PrpF